jgi:hypothetical protein
MLPEQKRFLQDKHAGLRKAEAEGKNAAAAFREAIYAEWFDRWPEPDRWPGDEKPDRSFALWRVEKAKGVRCQPCYSFTQLTWS